MKQSTARTGKKQIVSARENSLTKDEWDFSHVRDEELEACFLFEFFRELPDFAEPGKPFQSLPRSEKQKRMQGLVKTGTNPYDQFRRVQLHTGRVVYHTLRLQNRLLLLDDPDETKLLGSFVINWEQPDTAILKNFAIFLRYYRPSTTSHHKRGIKANSLRVHLERLGIMRLLHHYTPKEIKQNIPQAVTLYRNREWFKDRKQARQAFRALFPPEHNSELSLRSWPTKASRTK
jgi:hypothetical protein